MSFLHFITLLSFFFVNQLFALDIQNISEEISRIDLYQESCKIPLKNLTQILFDTEDKFINGQSLEQSKENINKLFKERLKIKDIVDKQTQIEKINHKCWSQLRPLIYSIRNLEDRYIQLIAQTKNKSFDQYLEFEGEPWYFLKNNNFDFNSRKQVRSGDVILSIGKDYTSAGISKIGKQESNFSHLSMVYRNSKGILMTIEAHGERGVIVRPIKAHYAEQDQISVLLRHKDSDLAKKAAKMIYEKAIIRQKKNKHIQYDFKMDYKNSKRLFCSEVIHYAYKLATNNEIDIAPYKTTFKEGHISFLKRFGLNITKKNITLFNTFGPGDIQWDPNFQIIAEWKNPKGIESARIKGIVVRNIFYWVNDFRYVFKSTKFNRIAPKIAVKIRKIPYYNFKSKGKRYLLDTLFSKNLKSKQISLYLMIDYLGEIIEKQIMKKRSEYGAILSYDQISSIVKKIRHDDLEKYANYLKLKQQRKSLSRKLRRITNRRTRLSKEIYYINQKIKASRPLFHKYFHPSKAALE